MTDVSRPRTAEPTWVDVVRMLNAADVDPRRDARRRDTSAASKKSAENRRRSAAERRAVEEFAPDVELLSPATVANLAELLIARCVGKVSDATLVDLTELLLVECERRGLPVPEL